MKHPTYSMLSRYLKYFLATRKVKELEFENAPPHLRDVYQLNVLNHRVSELGIMHGKPTVFTMTVHPLIGAYEIQLDSLSEGEFNVLQEAFIMDSIGCHYRNVGGKELPWVKTVRLSEIFLTIH